VPDPLRWLLLGFAAVVVGDLLIAIAVRRALPGARTVAQHVAVWLGVPLLVGLLGVLLPPLVVVVPVLLLAVLLIRPTDVRSVDGARCSASSRGSARTPRAPCPA
jgi:low temperature requirement protein LtrA